MIITISGDPGSGKSTIAKLLAEHLGFSYFSIGHLMREKAKELGVDLLTLSKQAQQNPSLDHWLDEQQKHLANKTRLVVDSRLGWYFLPKSIKIFLTIDPRIAAQRIYEKQREDNKGKSYDEILQGLQERKHSEYHRYQQYYGIDLTKKENYDLVIDTSDKSIEAILAMILQFLKTHPQSQHHISL